MVTSFFDLDRPPLLEDYVLSIRDEELQAKMEDFRETTVELINVMKEEGWNVEYPIIRIDPSPAVNAGNMTKLIVINQGLIDFCLSRVAVPIEEVIDSIDVNHEFLRDIVPKTALAWTFLHEVFHGVRGHDRLSPEEREIKWTAQATEYDADLCAIATVYRWYQRHLGTAFDDISIRKLVIFVLFWIVRDIPDPQTDDSHFSTAGRLYEMVFKMSNVRENPAKELADPDALLSGKYIHPLGNCIASCERVYQERNPQAKNNLMKDFSNIHQNSLMDPIIDRWEEIRLRIGAISGALERFKLTAKGMSWQQQ